MARIGELAAGSRQRFHHVETTQAAPSAVWAQWSDPSGWGKWDKGLKAAVLDGPFETGAVGTITPLKGPKSRFVIEEVDPGRSYTFATSLPGAKLRVRRDFVERSPGIGETAFRHTVWFDGSMAWLFSRLYGNQFRVALPPTMRALALVAESSR